MKRIFSILLLAVLLISCGVQEGRRTYKLASAPFPHQDRAEGYERKGIFYSAEEHYSDNSVGIVIPSSYKRHTDLDLIIHFHGWGNNVDKCIEQFKLAEQLEASGRDMILVVPEGPKNAPDSFDGKLCDEGGFSRFIDELLDSLHNDKIIRKKQIGSIIISGHSGGYYVMGNILKWGGYTEKISDVFIFDGLYDLEKDYLNWLIDYKGRLVNIYTEHGGTKDNTELFMTMCDTAGLTYYYGETKDMESMPEDRILILYSDLGHSDVIHQRENLLKLLQR